MWGIKEILLIRTLVSEYERQLLETLDSRKVVCQTYHSNVFIGNDCKIMLNNYEKLRDVDYDKPGFLKRISECFRI